MDALYPDVLEKQRLPQEVVIQKLKELDDAFSYHGKFGWAFGFSLQAMGHPSLNADKPGLNTQISRVSSRMGEFCSELRILLKMMDEDAIS